MKTTEIITRTLTWIGKGVYHYALWVVIAALLFTAATSVYVVRNLGFNTDANEMISTDLPFRRIYAEYKAAFPRHIGLLIVVVEADTPEYSKEAARILAERLGEKEEIFIDTYLPRGGDFLEQNGLLFLDIEELEDLTNDLARAQPAMVSLYQDPTLRGLFEMLETAVELLDDDPDIDLNSLFVNINLALTANLNGEPFALSWQDVMGDSESDINDRRTLVIVRPRFDYSRLFPAGEALDVIRAIGDELELERKWGIRVRTTGGAAVGHEEMVGLMEGSTLAGVASLVLVCLCLFTGLRSLPMVFATLLSLIMGIILTAGFATLAIGHLNLISIAFAVLYIGMGVDYAIHLCLRYQELVAEGLSQEEAIRESILDIGPALLMCTVSTAIGFYSFIPTAYAGVSELGLISGSGMFISLAISLTVLPALIRLFQFGKGRKSGAAEGAGASIENKSIVYRHARLIRWCAVVLVFGSLVSLPLAKFEFDPIKLRDQKTESIEAIMDIIRDSGKHPSTIVVLENDEENSRKTVERLEKLETVDKVVSIHDFVPTDQDEKMLLIDDLDLIIGTSLLDLPETTKPSSDEQIEQIEDFLAKLSEYPEVAARAQLSLMAVQLKDFIAAVESNNVEMREPRLESLEKSLTGTLQFALGTLKKAFLAEPFNRKDLPRDLFERWVSEDGGIRIQVFAEEDISDNDALEKFVWDVRTVAPDATSGPIFTYESGRAVVGSFKQAFVSAVILISILLFIVLRNFVDSLYVLFPLLVAGLFTGASTVFLQIPFNFANIIALPLLLGLGVDNGIHMVHRMRKLADSDSDFLKTSTARGVLFSALTTVFSFGTLIFLSHQGTASMGKLLTLGVLLTMATTLLLLPAFYLLRKKR